MQKLERFFPLLALAILILALIPATVLSSVDPNEYVSYFVAYSLAIGLLSLAGTVGGLLIIKRKLQARQLRAALSALLSLMIVSIPWIGLVLVYAGGRLA